MARYLTNFPRSDDFGFIAEDGDGSLLGGVWARCLEPSPTPTFVPPPGVPTISIATQPHVRGLGVGTALLYAIIESARKRTDCSALALHVRESNPARRLYQRVGFVDVPGAYFINSVGGNSFGMLLTLTDAARSR